MMWVMRLLLLMLLLSFLLLFFLASIREKIVYFGVTPYILWCIAIIGIFLMFLGWFIVHHNVFLIVFYLNMLGSICLSWSSHWTWWIWRFLAICESINFFFAIWIRTLSILIRWSRRYRRWWPSTPITAILTLLIFTLIWLYFFPLFIYFGFLRITILIITFKMMWGGITVRFLWVIYLIFLFLSPFDIWIGVLLLNCRFHYLLVWILLIFCSILIFL